MSDNDRYGYEGISSKDRAQNPLIRNNEILEKTDFQSSYNRFRELLEKHSSKAVGIMSAQSSCEEMYLFQNFSGITMLVKLIIDLKSVILDTKMTIQ